MLGEEKTLLQTQHVPLSAQWQNGKATLSGNLQWHQTCILSVSALTLTERPHDESFYFRGRRLNGATSSMGVTRPKAAEKVR